MKKTTHEQDTHTIEPKFSPKPEWAKNNSLEQLLNQDPDDSPQPSPSPSPSSNP